MTRYHPYSRRRLRRLFWQWVGANRFRVVVAVIGALVLVVFETWIFLISSIGVALRWYLIGSIHVLIVAAFVGALSISFLTNEAEAIRHVRGAWGEDFTRDELARARRRKLIWDTVDSVTVEGGDIDHLVVTRSGGLLAIDSKWRSGGDVDPSSMAAAARRARMRAEGVVRRFVQKERGAHRSQANSFRVVPLVVVWGAARETVPDGARVDGVDFVRGDRLVDWLSVLDGEVVDEASAADILARLAEFRSTSWRR